MILGIESTCDETSAALLRGGKEIVTNVIYSQIEEHKKNSYNFNTEVITVFIVTYVYVALRIQVIREPSPDYQ